MTPDPNSQQVIQPSRYNLPAPAAGTVRDLLRLESVKERFREVLADKAPQFIASLASLVYASRQLKACEPYTVIAAALKAAALDLPIEPSLGFAAIVPYGEMAQFQMQWKGYVQLALRTNQYANINVTETYTGMITGIDPFTGVVKKGKRTGDEVTGYYAYLKLINGFEKEVYMSVDEVLAHGKKYSKTFEKAGSTWKTNPNAMGRKTVIKQLLTRWGILSVEMQNAFQAEIPPQDTLIASDNGGAPVEADEAEDSSDEYKPDPAAIDRELKERHAKDLAALYGKTG